MRDGLGNVDPWAANAAAFVSGNAYRFFVPFSVSSGSPLVWEVTVTEPVILQSVAVDLHIGECTLETKAGGTPGGVFSSQLTMFNRNNLDGAPTPASPVSAFSGGSHSGGTVLDVLHPKTDSNTNRASSVGDTQFDERGITTGTYYFVLTSIAANSGGVLRGRFERPTFSYV